MYVDYELVFYSVMLVCMYIVWKIDEADHDR